MIGKLVSRCSSSKAEMTDKWHWTKHHNRAYNSSYSNNDIVKCNGQLQSCYWLMTCCPWTDLRSVFVALSKPIPKFRTSKVRWLLDGLTLCPWGSRHVKCTRGTRTCHLIGREGSHSNTLITSRWIIYKENVISRIKSRPSPSAQASKTSRTSSNFHNFVR